MKRKFVELKVNFAKTIITKTFVFQQSFRISYVIRKASRLSLECGRKSSKAV